LLLLEADSKATAEAVWGWREADLTVWTVRGRKMRTVTGLFDEMAAALQFPSYFGESWPAFDECFADMDRLSVDVGIVVDPDMVLYGQSTPMAGAPAAGRGARRAAGGGGAARTGGDRGQSPPTTHGARRPTQP